MSSASTKLIKPDYMKWATGNKCKYKANQAGLHEMGNWK